MDLESILEVLEQTDVGQRGAAVAVEEDQVREGGVLGDGVDLVEVLLVVDGDVPELQLGVNFQVGVLQSLPVNLEEVLCHDGEMSHSRDFIFDEMQVQTFLLHFLI